MALVPLLAVSTTRRRGLIAGAVAGVVYFGLLLHWTFRFAWFGWMALVLALAVQLALWGLVAGELSRRGSRLLFRVVGLASAFVVLEWTRGRWPFGGFAWGELGASQHGLSVTRAAASLGGVALVSWLLAAVNVALWGLLTARAREEGRRAAVGVLCGAAAVFAAGALSAGHGAPWGHVRVGVVQANRWDDRDFPALRVYEAQLAASRRLPRGLDLAVWGESSLNGADITRGTVRDVVAATGAAEVLANISLSGPTPGTFLNTNVLLRPDGTVSSRYAKRHLVPFGEWVPFRRRLGFVRQLDAVPLDAVPGHRPGLFGVRGATLGSLICFESVFPDAARDLARRGAGAIVVTTNNASFGRSGASAQSLAYTQLRAAETHRPVVVAAISGSSARIDAAGRIFGETGLYETATFTWRVPLYRDRTPYVRLGDWCVLGSWVLVLAALGAATAPAISGRVRRWRSRDDGRGAA